MTLKWETVKMKDDEEENEIIDIDPANEYESDSNANS